MKDFIDFIREQGVVGLAIAVVIGVAVKDTVDALVGGLINPLIALFIPADSLGGATFNIGESTFAWGSVVSALINLAVVALIIFVAFKRLSLDKLDKKKD